MHLTKLFGMTLLAGALVVASLPAAEVSAATNGRYVALGDSVAAGKGLPAWAGTDAPCGLSRQSYGAAVAKARSMTYQNFACSGATAGDLVTKQNLDEPSRDRDPQIERAFAYGRPSLISITAGANDVLWSYYINKCMTRTCGTTTDKITSAALLGTLRTKLPYSIRDISDRSNGNPPRVVLTGYYQPFSTACVQQNTGVTADELAWINKQTAALNKVISDTAKDYASFARYAPVSFAGHELCTSNPWIQDWSDPAPGHPTAAGQKVFARAVYLKSR